MKGRLEHELRTNKNIEAILKVNPIELTYFYLSIQVSKEPMSCLIYIRRISHFLSYTKKSVRDINTQDIALYFNSINYTKDKNGELKRTSSAYRQTVWSALNAFFRYLELNKIILNNPIKAIERPKSTDKVKRISLSMDELNKMLEYTNSLPTKWKERDVLILFLFMNTGMRRTALSEINVSDINFEDGLLTVTDKRNKEQIYTLTPEIETALTKWLIKRDIILNGKREDALFISARKNRISEKTIYDIVKKYSKMALGYSISPHKLRASFVSLFYEASGHDIKATCEAVGHANIETTSLYIVKKNNSRKEAINFMSSQLKI